MKAGDPFFLSCSVFVGLIMAQSENKTVLWGLYHQNHTSVIKHLAMTHLPVVLMLMEVNSCLQLSPPGCNLLITKTCVWFCGLCEISVHSGSCALFLHFLC